MAGEVTLPDVAGEKTGVVWFFVSPGETDIAKLAPRSMFPLRFAGKAAAGPAGIGEGVVPGDMNDRMVWPPRRPLRARAMNIPPVCSIDFSPLLRADNTIG